MTVAFTPLARGAALRLGNIDKPVGEKIHLRATPLMGGVGIYLGFAIAALLFLPLRPEVVGLLIGGLAAIVVGVADELLSLPPLVHLGGQVAAALVAIVSGLGVVHSISNPTAALSARGVSLPLAVGIVLTVLWMVGMMNTMNFLDGMDGLTTGVALIAALSLGAWAAEPHPFLAMQHEYLVLPLVLAGALLGFLPFNWHPARIFMGDSGAMFLGLTIAALSIVGPAKLGTGLLVLIIPVLDVAWAIVRRQMRGRSFITGDKQHVYHRMRDLGMRYTSIVLLLYFLVAALAVLDLVLLKITKLIAFVVLTVVISSTFVLLEIRVNRRRARLLAEGSQVTGESGL